MPTMWLELHLYIIYSIIWPLVEIRYGNLPFPRFDYLLVINFTLISFCLTLCSERNIIGVNTRQFTHRNVCPAIYAMSQHLECIYTSLSICVVYVDRFINICLCVHGAYSRRIVICCVVCLPVQLYINVRIIHIPVMLMSNKRSKILLLQHGRLY